MSWAQRLKRVLNIDISECERCQKRHVTIIAGIIDTIVIQKILAHLDKINPVSGQVSLLPPLRAPLKGITTMTIASNATLILARDC